MSAEGDALKAASDSLHDAIVNEDELEAAEWKTRYAALRDQITAYVDATDATLVDHESRIAALEP